MRDFYKIRRRRDMPHTHEHMSKILADAVAGGNVETVMGLLTDDIQFHRHGRSPMTRAHCESWGFR
jgi:hypothetical protein